MSPWISPWIAVIFSVTAFILYILAANGNSEDYKVLKGYQWFYYLQNVEYYYNWYHGDLNGLYKVYFGLKGYYIDTNIDGSNGYFDYDYDHGTVKDNCNKSGKTAFALTVVACILSIITVITNGAGGVSRKRLVNALKLSAVLSIISCLFGMIAVGIFMTTCLQTIYDEAYDYANLHYGSGFKLVIAAIICNFFDFILAIVNIIVGDQQTSISADVVVPLPVADVDINVTGGRIPLPVADVHINFTGGHIPLAVAERM